MSIADLMAIDDIQSSQEALMEFDPRHAGARPYPSHAEQFREFHGTDAWLFNPWTGEERHYSDIGSDPRGVGILVENKDEH